MLAIGEELYLGQVSLENFDHVVESNFGDIDSEIKYAVDFEKLRKDLDAAPVDARDLPSAQTAFDEIDRLRMNQRAERL